MSSRPGYNVHTTETVLLLLNLREKQPNGIQCVWRIRKWGVSIREGLSKEEMFGLRPKG